MQEKLDEIYRDLTANVVRIQDRQDLMMGVDIIFHSPLAFVFQGQLVQKGVAEMLIVGDTRTGKSATVRALIKHYGMGDYVQGESVSLAGLLGGIDEVARRRFLKMGRLPLCHRQLICIDEANEMDRELIGRLSGVRSTGIYDVMKIEQGKFPALVRMIWIANTRSRKPVSEYACGVESINDVIGKPEDIARFDIALCVSQRDVNRDALYRTSAEADEVEHRYTSTLCNTLIRWVWSRRADQIIVDDATERRILDRCEELSSTYDSGIPLVIEAEQRVKLARISCAIAGRLASRDRTSQKIIVKPGHVDVAYRYLDRIYSSKTMNYKGWSQMQRSLTATDRRLSDACYALGRSGIGAILDYEVVTKGDFGDVFGDKDAGNKVFTLLMLSRSFKRDRRGRRFTAAALDYMRRCYDDDIYPENPDEARLNGDGLFGQGVEGDV